MVPDKAIDLVDELLRDLHLRELNLVELANRIVRSHNFTDLGLTLGEQRMLPKRRPPARGHLMGNNGRVCL